LVTKWALLPLGSQFASGAAIAMALLSDGQRWRAIAKGGAMMWRSCASPGRHHDIDQQADRIDRCLALLALDYLARVISSQINLSPLLHSARIVIDDCQR
jgi:hypothetical protein